MMVKIHHSNSDGVMKLGKIIIEAADASELRKIMTDLFGSTAASGGALVTQSIAMAQQPQAETDGDAEDAGPVNSNAPALDSAGLPWDGRIHASSKAINESDGKWRMARGIEKKIGAAAIYAIEAELRARVSGAAPVQQIQQPQQPAPGMPVDMTQYQQPQTAAPGMPAASQQIIPTTPIQQQQPVYQQPAPVQQTPAPQGGAMPFNEFMSYIGRAFQTPRADGQGMLVDQGYLASLQAFLGVANIGEIQNDPNKITTAINQLKADGRWLGP